MSYRLCVILCAAAAIVATSAVAHDIKGPNGGRIVDAGSYHAELLGKGTSMEVFLTDQKDKPVSTSAIKGVAVIKVGGKSERVPLESAGGNKLAGSATTTVPAVPKGVVQITMPDGKTVQAVSK